MERDVVLEVSEGGTGRRPDRDAGEIRQHHVARDTVSILGYAFGRGV
jgi:hypothetical protein